MNKKKNTKQKNNLYNFRVGTPEKLIELKNRSKNIKDNSKVVAAEIYEDGLLVHEGRDEERTILNKKSMKKAIRNDLLDELIHYNAQIRAHNLRLKNLNPSRYKHLDVEDGVIKLFDENNNRIC